MSRSHAPWIRATVVLAVLAGGIAVARSVQARPQEPVPGVRTSTWKRSRDLGLRPVDGLAVQRTTIRPSRRYVGPAPAEQALSQYRQAGQCDAFYEYLRAEWKERVDAKISELNHALDEVSDLCEEATEKAKERIRGTADEFVGRGDQSKEQVEKALRAFLAQAHAERDISVSDSYGGVMRHYRVRQTLHPRVYALRQQDADLNTVRQLQLHDEIDTLIKNEGPTVLDLAAMDRAWTTVLAEARR